QSERPRSPMYDPGGTPRVLAPAWCQALAPGPLASPNSSQVPDLWSGGQGNGRGADRASDPTAGRAIDAATASRTNRAARKTPSPLYPACVPMSRSGLRACVVGPGVRRAGRSTAEPGADAGPAAPQAPP